jgi:LPXTG-motif cell wall-anchored protein
VASNLTHEVNHMKKLLSIALLLCAATMVSAQTADQSASNDRGTNTPVTRTDDNNHSNWGWLGLLGLAGLGGLAGRKRSYVADRDRNSNITDMSGTRRAA